MPQGNEDAAVLALAPGRYFAAVAFLYGKHPRDCLGAVFRDREGPWIVRYRFRYYRDQDAWSGKDEKRLYEATADGAMSEPDACRALRTVFLMLIEQKFNKRFDWLTLRTDDPKAIFELLKTKPWFQYKAVPVN